MSKDFDEGYQYTGFWTDQFTPLVSITWLLTLMFWLGLFLLPKSSELVSFLAVLTMTLIAGLFLTPFMSAGLSAEISAIIILILFFGTVIALVFYGIRRQQPAAIAIAGALVISLVGYGAVWISFAEVAFGITAN